MKKLISTWMILMYLIMPLYSVNHLQVNELHCTEKHNHEEILIISHLNKNHIYFPLSPRTLQSSNSNTITGKLS